MEPNQDANFANLDTFLMDLDNVNNVHKEVFPLSMVLKNVPSVNAVLVPIFKELIVIFVFLVNFHQTAIVNLVPLDRFPQDLVNVLVLIVE